MTPKTRTSSYLVLEKYVTDTVIFISSFKCYLKLWQWTCFEFTQTGSIFAKIVFKWAKNSTSDATATLIFAELYGRLPVTWYVLLNFSNFLVICLNNIETKKAAFSNDSQRISCFEPSVSFSSVTGFLSYHGMARLRKKFSRDKLLYRTSKQIK